MARTHKNQVHIYGNPEGVTLHEALEAVADWMDYESEVVEQAAEDLEALGETELAAAAEDQAQAMEEAAEEVHEAADEAREAAAIAFNEEGTPAVEIAAEETPEGEVVGGNTSPHHGSGSQGRGAAAGVIGGNPMDGEHEYRDGFAIYIVNADDPRYEVVRANGESMGQFPTEREALQYINDMIEGNPEGAPVVPAGGNPAPQPDPQGAAPGTAPANTTATPDAPPELDHWYNRPLIGRR